MKNPNTLLHSYVLWVLAEYLVLVFIDPPCDLAHSYVLLKPVLLEHGTGYPRAQEHRIQEHQNETCNEGTGLRAHVERREKERERDSYTYTYRERMVSTYHQKSMSLAIKMNAHEMHTCRENNWYLKLHGKASLDECL